MKEEDKLLLEFPCIPSRTHTMYSIYDSYLVTDYEPQLPPATKEGWGT